MADCILREEALNCNFRFEIYGRMSRKQIVKEAIQAYSDYIKKIPAVDAVEVVRCKDCKHRPVIVDKEHPYGFGIDPPKIEDSIYDDWDCPYLCSDPFYNIMPKDDWFCHRGEVKDG